ncbi:hypothetical protein HZS_5349 [Henneguya salminicola]|nr:hypothetical protein HZS_5349 [Henneguya salminicola]
MSQKSVTRFTTVSHISIFISSTLFVMIALSGFVSFGGSVEANLLNNYCEEDISALVSRIIFILILVLSIPLNIFTAREGICKIMEKKIQKYPLIPIYIGVVLLIILYLIGGFISNLEAVISITGAIVSIPLTFILPTATFIKLMHDKGIKHRISIILSATILIFGIILFVSGTVLSLIDAFKTSSNPIKYYCDSSIIESNFNMDPVPLVASLTSWKALIETLEKLITNNK